MPKKTQSATSKQTGSARLQGGIAKPQLNRSPYGQKTGSRVHTPKTPSSVILSGSLGEQLSAHAFERCRHFFLYCVTAKAIEYVNNTVQQRPAIRAASVLVKKATHQVDSGFAEDRTEYLDFPRDDAGVVDRPTTTFTRVDAAHFCNLGIKEDFAAKLDLTNPVVAGLFEELKVYAGNTRWLPKLVNIGPDRKIDVLHGDFAEEIFKDTANAICSRSRIKDYVSKAEARLVPYIISKKVGKRNGVAACAACYLAAYTQDDFVDRIFATISGGVHGWCSATNLHDARPLLVSN